MIFASPIFKSSICQMFCYSFMKRPADVATRGGGEVLEDDLLCARVLQTGAMPHRVTWKYRLVKRQKTWERASFDHSLTELVGKVRKGRVNSLRPLAWIIPVYRKPRRWLLAVRSLSWDAKVRGGIAPSGQQIVGGTALGWSSLYTKGMFLTEHFAIS